MLLVLLCFADGAEIADQPDVVLYAAVDKSASKKNENKVELVTEDVPEKKGVSFPISHPLLSLTIVLSVFSVFMYFYSLINIKLNA